MARFIILLAITLFIAGPVVSQPRQSCRLALLRLRALEKKELEFIKLHLTAKLRFEKVATAKNAAILKATELLDLARQKALSIRAEGERRLNEFRSTSSYQQCGELCPQYVTILSQVGLQTLDADYQVLSAEIELRFSGIEYEARLARFERALAQAERKLSLAQKRTSQAAVSAAQCRIS